jgi:hypothetical protein
MPTACPLCTHDQSAALLAALPHTSLRQLERQYGVSRSALQRHRTQGCPAQRPQGREPHGPRGELAQVITLLGEIKALLALLVQHRGEDAFTGTLAPAIPWNAL